MPVSAGQLEAGSLSSGLPPSHPSTSSPHPAPPCLSFPATPSLCCGLCRSGTEGKSLSRQGGAYLVTGRGTVADTEHPWPPGGVTWGAGGTPCRSCVSLEFEGDCRTLGVGGLAPPVAPPLASPSPCPHSFVEVHRLI